MSTVLRSSEGVYRLSVIHGEMAERRKRGVMTTYRHRDGRRREVAKGSTNEIAEEWSLLEGRLQQEGRLEWSG